MPPQMHMPGLTMKRKAVTVHKLKRAPEAPPKLMEGHVQDTKGDIRGRYRQTKSQGLLRNYADEHQISEDQLKAGEWYRHRALILQASNTGKDSTDADARLSRSGAARAPASNYQGLCLNEMISVESHLSEDDRFIIREVCGKDREASLVMRERFPREKSRHYPIPRLREALTKLDRAIANARVGGFKKFLLRIVN